LVGANKVPHPKRDDQWIKVLRKYLLAKKRLQQTYEFEYDWQYELADRYHSLWCAERIYSAGEEQRLRYELEASLLARVSNKDIADRYGIDEQTVEYYEKLFFNVVDKLDQRSYIAGTVLAQAFMSGLSNRTPEMMAKYFGYFAGPVVLYLILDAFDGAIPNPTQPTDIKRWLEHQFRLRMQANAVVGVTYLDASSYNISTLIEGYQMLLSLQYREKSTGGDDNTINHAVRVFTQQEPVLVGTQARQLPHRPGPAYAHGAVEPRVHELESVATGHAPAGLLAYNDPGWQDPSKRRLKGEIGGTETNGEDS